MGRTFLRRATVVSALVIAGVCVTAPALAGRPGWAGGGKGWGHEERQWERHESSHAYHQDRDEHHYGDREFRVTVRGYFGDRQRDAIRHYYAERFHGGHCPPGLARKHNGCMPPGLAKRWHVGRRLPRDVVFYTLPPRLVVELGAPPVGYRYVRVASDILLIAAGTGMVVDAISDLNGM